MQSEGIHRLIAAVDALPYWFPWKTDAVQLANWRGKEESIAKCANEVVPIIDSTVPNLLQDFIAAKLSSGTSVEKRVYASLDPPRLLTRLLHNRPVSFWGTGDRHCLRTDLYDDGTLNSERWGGFEAIGREEEAAPLLLREYISYDEMCLAALVSVFVPTPFINAGNRDNWCVPGEPETFEEEGVMVGCVGARLVMEGAMEARFMLVTADQNLADKGYGPNPIYQDPILDLWAKFYGIDHFFTYDEVRAAPRERFHSIEPWGGDADTAPPQFLDTFVYTQRIRRVVKPFLVKASHAGGARGSHVRVKGLGLGVWQVDPVQEALMLKVYAEVLRSMPLPGIQVLEFQFFPTATSLQDGSPSVADHGGERFCGHGGRYIEVRFTRHGFAAPVEGGRRLVAMYAWDGNAYPGNEWWAGNLGMTDDSAAASCSLITSLQNPEVNPTRLTGEVAEVVADDGTVDTLPRK